LIVCARRSPSKLKYWVCNFRLVSTVFGLASSLAISSFDGVLLSAVASDAKLKMNASTPTSTFIFFSMFRSFLQ
jgi:hypothetical protein